MGPFVHQVGHPKARPTLLAPQTKLLFCPTGRVTIRPLPAPAVCFLLRMPPFQRCLTLSLGQELTVSKWPLRLFVGHSALYSDQGALVHLLPPCGWACLLCLCLYLSFLPPWPLSVPFPRRQEAWQGGVRGVVITHTAWGRGRVITEAQGLESTSGSAPHCHWESPGLAPPPL